MKNLFKNLLLITLILVLPFLTGCQNKKEKIEENESGIKEETQAAVTPLFYKITSDKSDAAIYLLGSIHVADDSIYPLSDNIMLGYSSSDYLAVEVDIVEINTNLRLQMQMAQKMLYKDGSKIKDHLGEDLYNQMVDFLREKNSYMSIYDKYKPAFFESLLESAMYKDACMDANNGIDMHFLNLAKEEGKEILEVETLEFQYDLLTSNPIELDKLIITDYIVNYDKNISEIKDLYLTWKQGNIAEIEKQIDTLNIEGLTNEEIELINAYNQTLIIDRNYGMANTLEQYMSENKNVFCVVGLAHIVGDEGIAKLMKEKGYTVEKVEY